MTNSVVPTIDVATLRLWMEQRRPLTVLDVRPTQDRAEWSIPGSLHIDAYDALWRDDPTVLADVALPANTPVVAVCNAGKTSILAARQLQARGFHSISLDGGMKAWSLAWNTAEASLAQTNAQVVQVRRTGKGCLSYIIGSAGKAAVIDASLPPEVYFEIAQGRDWRITHVFDTHVHADHLSRTKALAELVEATLLLPQQNRVTYAFRPVHDGDVFEIGNSTLRSIHTPGHTFESTSYLLDEIALFTGDTLFPSAIGRPDLLAGPGAEDRAAALYHSLQRVLGLDDETQIFGCHSSEPVPFDGQPLGTTLAAVRAWLTPMLASQTQFVETTLANLPPSPPNHQRIVVHNEAGRLPEADITELEAGANRCAVPR
jgi:glyoxylase-like metal-dependent hydrolase (beta-lactamase superfamily II)